MISQSWTTADEIEFLRRIGTYNEGSKKQPRSFWLRQYIQGASQRWGWERIDSKKVLRFAQAELRKCRSA